MKAKKGSQFERDVCRQLSLWWTDGERDDVFWRTSGSGARAKTRSKTGKKTFGQYGDVQATDPIGQPLIDLCTIELKRGYSRYSIMDLLDKPNGAADQMWEKFIKQAKKDSENAGTPYWMLITKRDRRETLVTISEEMFDGLIVPYDLIEWRIGWSSMITFRLSHFMKHVKAKNIKAML